MAISFTKYVEITSGVGGAAVVSRRELIGRIITQNSLVPTGGVLDFTDVDEVGDYFGTSSEEYQRAVFYFGFISKNIKKANKISYVNWAAANTAPLIFGDKTVKNLADFTSISDGALDLTLGSITAQVAGMDFTTAINLSGVATIIQTQIQAANVDPLFSSATVTYNALRGSFDLVAGATGAAIISTAAPSSGTNILNQVGWVFTETPTTTSAIFSNGVNEQTPLEAIQSSEARNNNFGSFLFMDALTIDEISSVASWNSAQNNYYIYTIGVSAIDVTTYQSALSDFGGTALTLIDDNLTSEYDEMAPMIVLAATDYTARNSVQNYMFQQFSLTPKVSDDSTSNQYDAISVNYYGATQTAGNQISFYQKGFLQGLSTDALDMGVYSNEMWLKDAAGSELMNLLLSLPSLPSNENGVSQVISTIQNTAISEALFNGVISIGKLLSNTQKQFIESITGDELAWYQVQNSGYFIQAEVQEPTAGNFIIAYTLIYAKNDSIRKVEGTHTLI